MLFFTRFNFSLSYCPGSRNVKPDTLSKQFAVDEDQTEEPKTIFPLVCVVASLTWDVEEKVRAAQASQSGPRVCLDNQLNLPGNLRAEWGHSSHLACHPGAQRTCTLLRQRCWWP